MALSTEIILIVNGSLLLLSIIGAGVMVSLSTRYRLLLGNPDRISLESPILILLLLLFLVGLSAAIFNLIFL